MAENKTKETEASVASFLSANASGDRLDDAHRLVEIFATTTGYEPRMWGPSIVGFGSYHYKYESGREGDAPKAGFSPRKDAFALYFSSEYENREELMSCLGKHKSAKACVYVKKLSDIDIAVLVQMIEASVRYVEEKYG